MRAGREKGAGRREGGREGRRDEGRENGRWTRGRREEERKGKVAGWSVLADLTS